jgi:hypothetical protein
VQLRWSELAETHRPGEWQGLSLTVLGAPAPGLTVSVCAPKRIRLAAQERPLLWARIDDFYSGYELLRSSEAISPGVIPPIPFALAEQHRHAGDRPGFDRAWARAFAEMLANSNACPLSDGPWRLGSNGGARGLRDLAPNLVTKIVGQQSHGYLEWDFGDDLYPITLRQLSSPESGRVRAWRKLVRNASLPPILLYWVSGLDAYVVLDGHDRLLAASLENASAPALLLESVREHETDEATQAAILRQVTLALEAANRARTRGMEERLARAQRLMTVEGANRLLLDAFVPAQHAGPTRAAVLAGGVDQWAREVTEQLAQQQITESELLNGLSG